MKTPKDPRHLKREKAVKALFGFGFNQEVNNPLARAIIKNQKIIDKMIADFAPDWPIAQINRIDLAILRLALFELAIKTKEPPKVVIDEAVELAKKFGSQKSPNFINGVLGTAYKKINSSEK